MKKKPIPSMTIAERFAGTHPNFQATLSRIASVARKDAIEVFALWRDYSDRCQSYDQSALVGEFIQWYSADLGGDVEALRQAEFASDHPNNVISFPSP